MAWDFSMCVPLWGVGSREPLRLLSYPCSPPPPTPTPFAKAFLPHLYDHGWRRSLPGSLPAPGELPYKTDRLRQCPHMYEAHCS